MKLITFTLFLLLALSDLKAQDYQISFTGTGASSKVDSVKVENLSNGEMIFLGGNEALHLTSRPTVINPIAENSGNVVRIYPNPARESCTVEFTVSTAGNAILELFDPTGKCVGSTQNVLAVGTHSYQVRGLLTGLYILKIRQKSYSWSGKLISHNLFHAGIKLTYRGAISPIKLKNATTEKQMQYNYGDWLKFTGKSGIYSTVVTDRPTENKNLTFTFIPCTDADGNNYPVVKIGTQFWMAENLRTSTFQNGASIPYSTESTCNEAAYTGCWSCEPSRYQYNMYAVDNLIVPLGWHIPSDEEWQTVINFSSSELFPHSRWVNTIWPNSFWSYSYWCSDENENDLIHSNLISSNLNGWHFNQVDKSIFSDVICVIGHAFITFSPNNVTTTTATSGGKISSYGRGEIIDRGVCWSTKPNPTLADQKTSDGSGNGSFTSQLSGLSPNTTYYIRAYATTSKDTIYATEKIFKTYQGTFSDAEGNVYYTTKIGIQTWMAENLRTTKYQNGEAIMDLYLNQEDSLVKKYGQVYTWKAATDKRNIAPAGWHVPDDSEWTTLFNFLGGRDLAGDKMKESGTVHWYSPNTRATNESGFTALPGGCGDYYGLGEYSAWWSTSAFVDYGHIWYLNNEDGFVSISFTSENIHLSIRCVKDE